MKAPVTMFGCPLHPLSAADILHEVRHAITHKNYLTIEGLNVAKLVHAQSDGLLMQALHTASIVHMDGAGIALGAAALGHHFPPRRAGIDLMGDMLALCASIGAGVYLLGATPDVITITAQQLRARYPALIIRGYRDGYFSETHTSEVAAAIKASGAALLLVGMSSPKKELFLQRWGKACGVQVAMGVGGAFDVVAGNIARAPVWMQRYGMEWMFRLLQEPRRLAGRYAVTNSLFAWMLVRAWIRRPRHSTALAWPEFLTLLQRMYVAAASHCRHEIYFLHHHRYAPLRSLVALCRDAWMLFTAPIHAPSRVTVYGIASLAGPSGMATVQRAIDALPPATPHAIIAHPRLVMAGVLTLARPTARDGIDAIRHAWQQMAWTRGPLRRSVIFTCLIRSFLWQAAWQRTKQQHPAMARCLLHNDFDMMNNALISALGDRVQMECIQHGIPTDEFFPTRAPKQTVWGESSRAVYAQHSSATLVVDALGRSDMPPVSPPAIPHSIHLISQTHTPVYGTDLGPHFVALAHHLAQAHTPHSFRILLHPSEVDNHPYPTQLQPYLSLPPHAALQPRNIPRLVIGYSSTALIEAALAGHYVATMEWPVKASYGARAVCYPPVRCRTVEDVLALWHRLRISVNACAAHRSAQRQWLGTTFTESTARQGTDVA